MADPPTLDDAPDDAPDDAHDEEKPSFEERLARIDRLLDLAPSPAATEITPAAAESDPDEEESDDDENDQS